MLESSLGAIVMGLGGKPVQEIYNLMNITRMLTIVAIVFGGLTLGFSAAGKEFKLGKGKALAWLVIAIIVIGVGFSLQTQEFKVEKVQEYKPFYFPQSQTFKVRLQIPSDQYGIFWCEPEKGLNQEWVKSLENQAKASFKDKEIVKIDREVTCKIDVLVGRTYQPLFPTGVKRPPYDVEIKAGEFQKTYYNIETWFKERLPEMPVSQRIEVYVYPGMPEDMTVTFTAYYYPKFTVHYYETAKPYILQGLRMALLGYSLLAALNIALIASITREKGGED
jgi:hypothetical protein